VSDEIKRQKRKGAQEMEQESRDRFDGHYRRIIELADGGNPVAMEAAGRAYLMGDTGVVDAETARSFLRQGAEEGHVPSMFHLAQLITMAGSGFSSDMDAATEWTVRAADSGYPDAMFMGLLVAAKADSVELYALWTERLSRLAVPHMLFNTYSRAVVAMTGGAEAKLRRSLAECSKLTERIKRVSGERDRVRRDFKNERRAAKGLKEEVERLRGDLASLSASALERRVAELEGDIARLKEEAETARNEASKAKADARREVEKGLAGAMSERDRMRRELADARARNGDFERKIRRYEKLLRVNGIPFNPVAGHGRNHHSKRKAKSA